MPRGPLAVSARARARHRGIPPAGWLALVGLAALPALAARPVSDLSPWLHLRVGAFLNAGGRFGQPDPWAPFAVHSYVPTQWLPSMATAWLYEHVGLAVVVWERAAGIGVLALALFVWGLSIARTWLALVACSVAMLAAWGGLSERPQLAGFILLVAMLVAWWRTGQDLRPRWHLVPLTWLAASTHGVWAIGLALGGVVVLGLALERRGAERKIAVLAGLLVACTAAAALTPIGPRLLLTPFSVGSQGRQFVAEWLPSSVRSPAVIAVLGLLALAWWCWIGARYRPELWRLGLWLAAFALTMSMQRTVPVGAFVALPLALDALERRFPSTTPPGLAGVAHTADAADAADVADAAGSARPAGRPLAVAALLATVVGTLVALPVSATMSRSVGDVPEGLLPALHSLPAGSRVISQADLTGWLLWEAPALAPVEDIRIESYSAEHVRRYIAAMAAEPGWAGFIADTGATEALLPSRSPLAAALSEQAKWRVVGTDRGLVLLEAPR